MGEYKYLGSNIDAKLDLLPNALALLKKGNQRLYFMRRPSHSAPVPRCWSCFTCPQQSVLNSSLCHFSILKEQDWAWLSWVVVIDRFYITLFSALEQTHYAPRWFYMSD